MEHYSSSRKTRLVMIGNGMAGIRTLEYLLEFEPGRYDITVFGAEPFGNYNRIMLSPVLANEMSFEDIVTHNFDWYKDRGIRLHSGKAVVAIDRYRRQVIAEDGTSCEYDRLILATGSSPTILPVAGNRLEGVIGYRDIFDVRYMLETAETRRRAVVIGGGLLGLEAANGLKQRGMDVTVVHNVDVLMGRQLDATASNYLRQAMESRGIQFLTSHVTGELVANEATGRVKAVKFQNGSQVMADLVVMAVGVRPNIALAQDCGLQVERGVLVDDTLQTYDPRIYAVGECAQHRGMAYGLVAPLYEQARVCASHVAGHGICHYGGSVVSTKLKVTGINIFSAGDFHGDESSDCLYYRDPVRAIYKKIVLKNNRITGIILYGDTRDSAWYFEKMQRGENISPLRENLLFGRRFAPAIEQSLAA